MPSTRMPLPTKVILPLQDTTGEPFEIYVRTGDRVVAGQKVGCIGTPPEYVAVHAPIAGLVAGTGLMPHPLGHRCFAVRIQADGATTQAVPCVPDGRSGLLCFLREMGVPLSCTSRGESMDCIVNVTEFEPCFSSAVRLVIEEQTKIREGLRLLTEACGLRRTVLLFERRHAAMASVLQDICAGIAGAAVQKVDRPYPNTLGELLRQRLRRQAGQTGAAQPRDYTMVVEPAVIVAVHDAYYEGKPFLDQMVSVTGSGISSPQNIWVPHGTALGDVIRQAGGTTDTIGRVSMGGPLMGQPQSTLDAPVIKKVRGIFAAVALVISEERRSRVYKRQTCIRCAKCIDVCPASIAPNLIVELIEHGRWSEANTLGLFACLECGLCHFVCPSMIPLAETLLLGKLKIGGPESILRFNSCKTLST